MINVYQTDEEKENLVDIRKFEFLNPKYNNLKKKRAQIEEEELGKKDSKDEEDQVENKDLESDMESLYDSSSDSGEDDDVDASNLYANWKGMR